MLHSHPDPPGELNTGSIVHVATGPVALALFIGPDEGGRAIYAGPALTYYEMLTRHPHRMTDEAWRGLLSAGRSPEAPSWTESFRWSAPPAREQRSLPMPEAPRRQQ